MKNLRKWKKKPIVRTYLKSTLSPFTNLRKTRTKLVVTLIHRPPLVTRTRPNSSWWARLSFTIKKFGLPVWFLCISLAIRWERETEREGRKKKKRRENISAKWLLMWLHMPHKSLTWTCSLIHNTSNIKLYSKLIINSLDTPSSPLVKMMVLRILKQCQKLKD